MALARHQFHVTDDAGNAVPNASIDVRREAVGNPVVSLYEDRAGATPLGNPFNADSDGFAAFHVAGGAYRITATSGAFSRVWRYVGIGLAQETDALTTGISFLFDDATTDADPGAGLVRFDHATLASVSEIFVDNLSSAGVDISAWLDTFDNGGSSGDRGSLLLTTDDGAGVLFATVTGSVVDGTGYRKISVTPIASAGVFLDGAGVNASFSRAGTDGEVPSSRTLTAGAGLTGGGDLSANRTFAVGAGTGMIANADDVAIDKATDANVRAAASNKVLTADRIETASAGVALTDAATVAVDWDSGINFTLTVTANRAIGNPTNGQPGTWRTILVQGNSTTDRTITFGNQFLGEVPTITDCDNARWYLLMIYCVSSTHFVVSSKKANGS